MTLLLQIIAEQGLLSFYSSIVGYCNIVVQFNSIDNLPRLVDLLTARVVGRIRCSQVCCEEGL